MRRRGCDYARRFLAWRTGDYRPRGVAGDHRPVPDAPVTADALEEQANAFAQAVEAAGREHATTDTYHRRAMFFVRWLRREFRPGDRLKAAEARKPTRGELAVRYLRAPEESVPGQPGA